LRIAPFDLERYFARHEFSTPHLLSVSDCEGLALAELLEMADDETAALWQGLKLGYTDSQGHPLLRAEIAGLYQRIAPDQVLALTPEEGIFIAMNVLLRPGDHVVATFPGYQSLYEVAQAIGCQVTRWEPQRLEGGWRFDLGQLRELVREETRLLVVNFPHNPTGATLPREEWLALVELARERGLWLFSDEMYRLLEYDVADRLPSASDLYERAIALSGLSKAFALAGLRLGWLTARDAALMRELAAYKDYTTICHSAPSEVLGIIALRARERITARNLEIIRGNLRLAEELFRAHADLFWWAAPRAGSVAFPALRQGSAQALCDGLRQERGVLLLPASVFGYGDSHFRVGLGRRGMEQGFALLQGYITDHIRGCA